MGRQAADDAPHVRHWLMQLTVMIGKGHFKSEDEWNEIYDLYVPGLVMRFGAAALDARCLEGVALECRNWPGYGDLAAMLQAWLREHRPAPVAVEDAALSALRSDQRGWVKWWFDQGRASRPEIARRASMLRSQAPDAWDFLVSRDPALLAYQPAARVDVHASWQDEAGVRRSVDGLAASGFPPGMTGVLRAALASHAPQHLIILETALAAHVRQRDARRLPSPDDAPAAIGDILAGNFVSSRPKGVRVPARDGHRALPRTVVPLIRHETNDVGHEEGTQSIHSF